MSEKKSFILRRLLDLPFFYNLFNKVLGKGGNGVLFSNNYLDDVRGKKILDLGCGTADILDNLQGESLYVGIDYNREYIIEDNEKYKDRQTAKFHCIDLNTYSEKEEQKFDIVLMAGVMHHISDEDVRAALKDIKRILLPGGYFVSYDPCFTTKMNPLAKIICKLDRGKYVRHIDSYVRLQKEVWDVVNYEIHTDTLRFLPYSAVIFKCCDNKN